MILLIPNKKISALFLALNEITFIPFLLAWLDKKLKNLSSLFKIIFPPSNILSIISALALAISFKVLKFLKWAPEIFVIIAISGLTIFD